MLIEIAAFLDAAPSEAELRELREWLLDEQAGLRPEWRRGEDQPGWMGPVSETLQIAVGSTGVAAVLARSVRTWLETRRQPVRLKWRRPDGEEIEINGSVKDPEEAIVRFLEASTRPGD
jgi:hypothetical protein